MIKPSFKLEKELWEAGYEIIIGIDEAGKGPLAGPVVACAVAYKFEITNPKNSKTKIKSWNLIRDSKTLNHKQRESLVDFIYEYFHVGIGICDHKTIDRMNIFQASFLAMKKALTELKKTTKKDFLYEKSIILLDGRSKIPNFSGKQRAIVRGDKTIKSISAASIVAKVTRDRIMMEMHGKYPQYYFDKHKGYGTKLHMEALKKHGPCEIHRKSFAPVKLAKTTK